IYYTLNGSDPRVSGTGAISSAALAFTGPITIGASEHVIARVRDSSGNWSPLTDAIFLLPTLFPVRITELNYHPGNHAGVADPEDMEFIELLNTSSQAYNLQGVTITSAIDPYVFGNVTLNAGQYIVVARKPNTFTQVYGAGINQASPGYSGKLDNSGERVTLLGPLGETLQDFTYDDAAPWPDADGNGSSLEIVDPLGDPNDPANWRASYFAGGSPGTDGVPLAGSNGQLLFSNLPALSVALSKSITVSTLDATDLTIQSTDGGTSFNPMSAQWNALTRTITFALPSSLADGNYTATIPAGSLASPDGFSSLAYSFNFFILTADANRDRTVNLLDLNALATNFGKTGMNFDGGDFDFSGTVDIADFNLLASNFGVTLTLPSNSAPALNALSKTAAQSPFANTSIASDVLNQIDQMSPALIMGS
ncbi:MAG TPA: lamin tail domain-containing protein, partial [Tepidisphaeraceae bacterium]|nr:lamin tail domain-containing protein [Tepidisphaeraceae bacterium]